PSIDSDWRSAAFPEEGFDARGGWSADPVTQEAASASPFPTADKPLDPVELLQAEPKPAAAEPQETEIFVQPFGGFGGADVEDALEATSPGFSTRTAQRGSMADDIIDSPLVDDGFEADTDFVDPRRLRASMGAAAAAGRASSTRSTIDAARAAITAPIEPQEPPRQGFGLMPRRGGKSKLQERLDKQAAKDGSVVKKGFLASVTAVALTGGAYASMTLADGSGLPDIELPGFGQKPQPSAATDRALLAMAVTPADAVATSAAGAAEFDRARARIEAGDAEGVEELKRAANLGYAPAQTYL
ncbi:hypothetical protein LTR94_028434, partial [Friedmanniomyces endolithicus]